MLSVTHELKSPLSSIKLYLQTLLKRDLKPEKQKEITRHALADSDRLGILIDNILTASRLENGKFNLHKENDDLGLFVQRLALQHFQQGLGSHKLYTAIKPGIFLAFDKMALSVILGNILDNAIKYSPAESTVSVVLSDIENQGILLKISDQGIGIPQNEKSNIFEKFYRIGNEDTRKTKGAGLGLYIVKTLADLHHIEVLVEESMEAGTVFSLKFKRE
jgi:putative cofactor-binding repeat protein